jgi:hypothetical protein
MRHRTAALLFGAAAATGAAAIGATTAMLLGRQADERVHRACTAMARALVTMPRYEPHEPPPDGQRPGLVLVKSGEHG